jgi:protein gp37
MSDKSKIDLFHEDVPFEFIDHVFAAMAAAPEHTFQVLTKRPRRMLEYMTAVAADGSDDGGEGYQGAHFRVDWLVAQFQVKKYDQLIEWLLGEPIEWPLPNVWLGVTCENQRWANERIPLLLDTPAAVRFVSCEPLLGPISFEILEGDGADSYVWPALSGEWAPREPPPHGGATIDWVIVGGESAGWEPKPQALAWVRSIRDQCLDAGVPFEVRV